MMVKLRRTYTLFTGTMTDRLAQNVVIDLLSRVEAACGIIQRNNRSDRATFQSVSDEIESRLQDLAARSTPSRSNSEPSDKQLRPEVSDCAYQLSIACLEGQGTRKDPELAMRILDIAATLGSRRAYHDRALLAVATGNPETTATLVEQELHSSSVPENRPWYPDNHVSPLTYYAMRLSPTLVRVTLSQLRYQGLTEQALHEAMARSLIQVTRMNDCQLILTGRENWKTQLQQVLQILATPEAMQYVPDLTSSKGHINFLTFAAEYNTTALKWLIEKYTVQELKILFPQTFSKHLAWSLSPNIHCGNIDRVDMVMKFAAGNPLLSKCCFFITAVHHQPSLVPHYGELFKQAGAKAALLESNSFGETPFDVALQYGFTDVMNYLLGNGASYDEYRIKPDFRVDQSECSPLATVLGYKTQVDFLMQLNPKPNLVVTRSGMNVFHVLASKEAALGKSTGSHEPAYVI